MIAKFFKTGSILLTIGVMFYFQPAISQNCSGSGTTNITGTILWNTSSMGSSPVISQDICIETGGTLTIDGIILRMDGFRSITVHKGGALNIRNATIRTNTGTSNWDGIYVMGENDQPLCDEVNRTLNTTDHGKLMADGSTFEDCNTAIRLMAYGDNDGGGGIISVNNCTFYNVTNRAIYAGSFYPDGTNCAVNSVANSTFLNDDADLSPTAFIELVSYHWFTILGCSFEILSSLKKETIGVLAKERSNAYIQAGKITFEASEYTNPYDYQNSPKNIPPKRNKFINLRRGIQFSGNETTLTSFESIVKACDFDRVWMALDIQFAQNINVLCNTYTAKIYDISNGFDFQYTENDEDKDGNWTRIIPIQTSPTFFSVFAYCFNIHGNINFYNNNCEWDNDFSNTKAAGVIFNWENDLVSPGLYFISGNTFRYTGTEGGKVTGLLIHGKFDWSTDIVANTFDKLFRDIHLKGTVKPAGGSCFQAVLDPQGYIYSNPPSSVGKGNIFSNPPGDPNGNIYGDAADIFYVKPGIPPPDYDPNYRLPCVSVYTAAASNNAPAWPVECGVIPVSGLLDDGTDLLRQNASGYCLDIAPNPFTDRLTIGLGKNLQFFKENSLILVIYNSQAIEKYVQTIDPQISFIDIDSKLWPSGLYLATLQDGDKIICSTKIIKK